MFDLQAAVVGAGFIGPVHVEGDFQAVGMYPTFEEGHREVVLCEAVLESHRKEAWITL